MRRLLNGADNAVRRWARGLVCASLGLCGCAGFWDDITSRDFHVKNLFVQPNPYLILKDSDDGDKRAKAIRSLKEPKQNGGTAKEQDVVMEILEAAATTEKQALCRLAAMQKLGEFQDPRAVPALVKAFYAAKASRLYPPQTVTVMECQVLTALGQTRNPAAVEHLVLVVKEPPAADDVSQEEKQHSLDRRTAAARALGNFSQYQATDALVQVLKNEKDVALRDRVHESLVKATGKKLPPDSKAWDDLLHKPPEETEATADGTFLDRIKNVIQPVKHEKPTGNDK